MLQRGLCNTLLTGKVRRRNKRSGARKRAGDDAKSLLSECILRTERPACRLN